LAYVRIGGLYIFWCEVRVIVQYGFNAFPLREEAQNELDGDPHSSDNGFSPEDLTVARYSLKQFLLSHRCSPAELTASSSLSITIAYGAGLLLPSESRHLRCAGNDERFCAQ
jgi:hypothetical protein